MSRASGLFSVRRVRQQVFEKSSPQGGETAKGAGGERQAGVYHSHPSPGLRARARGRAWPCEQGEWPTGPLCDLRCGQVTAPELRGQPALGIQPTSLVSVVGLTWLVALGRSGQTGELLRFLPPRTDRQDWPWGRGWT